jgi:hypothetical protein
MRDDVIDDAVIFLLMALQSSHVVVSAGIKYQASKTRYRHI